MGSYFRFYYLRNILFLFHRANVIYCICLRRNPLLALNRLKWIEIEIKVTATKSKLNDSKPNEEPDIIETGSEYKAKTWMFIQYYDSVSYTYQSRNQNIFNDIIEYKRSEAFYAFVQQFKPNGMKEKYFQIKCD